MKKIAEPPKISYLCGLPARKTNDNKPTLKIVTYTMNSLTKFLFAAFAMTAAVVSCDTVDPEDKPTLKLTADKMTITNDGEDAVTFTVTTGRGVDVTQSSSIMLDGKAIEGTTFSSTETGRYTFTAFHDNVVSNTVTVEVLSPMDGARFEKNVAFFTWTATWCGPCGDFKKNMKNVEKDYGDRMVALNFYTTSPHGSGTPCNPLVANTITDQYINQIKAEGFVFSGFPTSLIELDATMTGSAPESTIRAAYAKYIAFDALTGIKVDSKVNGSKINASVEVCAEQNGRYYIAALLVESGIVCEQNTNSQGYIDPYTHDNVLRAAGMPNIFGEELGVMPEGSMKSKSYSFDIKPEYNVENLRLVIYTLYEKGPKRVIANIVKVPVNELTGYKFAEN